MKPLSFDEFLLASGYEQLREHLSKLTLSDEPQPAITTKAEELLREYFITGGMPSIVANYIVNATAIL